MTSTKYVYRIRDRDGLFSAGGMAPIFTKKGKTWSTEGALSNHFALLDKRTRQMYIDRGCEVVYCAYVEAMSEPISIRLDASTARAKAREDEQKARLAQYRKDAELRELERLARLHTAEFRNLKLP